MLKDLSFLIKKLFFSEKYLLEKRIKRSLINNLEPELNILKDLTDKSKASIDIGVFRGVYSYALSDHSTNVYGFEANPIMFKTLHKNLLLLKNNIKLFNVALSSVEGEANLKIPLRNKSFIKKNFEDYYEGGLATIEDENTLDNNKYDVYLVKTRILDSFKFSEKIGFIKIDVEGHEFSVIKGGIELLKKDKPNLLIEIDKKHSHRVNETFKFLYGLGYSSFFFDDKNLIKINSYEENFRDDFKNFIFKWNK
jgi:FkbM family methyltransferase